jgi:hypothetical protein
VIQAYFGQLSAVVSALSDAQVIVNANAGLLASQPDVCVETVVFGQVDSKTGVVFAQGLETGWTAAEPAPGQEAQVGNLHQQLVVPPSSASLGQSWRASATLSTPGSKLQSDTFSLQLLSQAGATQTWLVDDSAVNCDVRSGT